MSKAGLAQFQQVFIEESLEGLDTMESSLLALDEGGDPELVHTIFRAAHSIKGGAATFGFPEMSSFTHEAESLLDEVRGGKRAIDGSIIELLLRTVDCLRGMFARAQAGEPLNDAVAEGLRSELAAAMGRGVPATAVQARRDVDQADAWAIRFRPHAGMLAGGNEPLRLIRELAGLGELAVTPSFDRLPSFAALEPTECHLGWTIELKGPVKRADITGVFDWVEDECDLEIEARHVVADAAPAPVAAPVAAPAAAVADAGAVRAQREASAESSSVRVSIDKIDGLINLVGELVINQSMLDTFREGDIDASRMALLEQGLAQLARHTRELQESVMGIRMLPIASVFNRFPRMVRDISQKLGKQVKLELVGEQTELDKTVLEKIGDPMVHLVRNAIDHGLETPDKRRAAGKGDTGTLTLQASHRGGNVVEVSDDGAGLNRDAIVAKAVQRGLITSGEGMSDDAVAELIFQPGFSTAAVTTDLSGRGVGMDVVRRNVADLGGTVTIRSTQGKGSVFTITLPLTLAIIDGLTAAVGEERYIVPLVSIVESVQLRAEAVRSLASGGELFRFRGEYLPVIRLHDAFGCEGAIQAIDEGLMVVVEGDGTRVGLFVDGLIGQQQAVVKSLEANYRRVQGVSGATILADGSVALIVDIAGLVRMQGRRKAA